MKIGEIWKYKNWVCILIDENLKDYNPPSNKFSMSAIRIEITNLHGEVVWFREFSAEDSEYSIRRENFIQIFEKVYEE